MASSEHPDDLFGSPVRLTSTRRSTISTNTSKRSVKASNSLEELLYYKGQPAVFFPARLQSPEADLIGALFPSKLVKTFAISQLLTGVLLISIGVVAILVRSSLSSWGGGIWTGSLVVLTGFSGLLTSKRPASTPHIVSFLIISLFALAASGLLIVLGATGLATDANTPPAHYIDDEGRRISFLGEVPLSTQAVAVNGIIVVLSVLASLLSIACCVLSAREACQCYGSFISSGSSCRNGRDTDMRQDRLMNWLGQQAVVNTLPSGRSYLVKTTPVGKYTQEKLVKEQSPPPRLEESPSVSSNSTLPSRLSSYIEGKEEEEEKVVVPPVKVDDKYLAIDKKLAEDYIERLTETDEKRLCATYEVIAQEARPLTSFKKNHRKKRHDM